MIFSSTNWGSKRFKMKWIIAGIFLATILFEEAKTLSIESHKSKRSINLDDVYYHKLIHGLPKGMIPESYHLEIEPIIQEGIFKGRVRMNFTCSEKTDTLILSAHPDLYIRPNMTVREFIYTDTGEVIGWPLDIAALPPRQTKKKPFYPAQLQQMMTKNTKYEVEFSFYGHFSINETAGFFKSQYFDTEGEIHQFAATYLPLDHAQKIFPCLDDPRYKATFKLSIKHPKSMIACSNTPLENTTEVSGEPDMIWSHFLETPKMSTYQLAFIISDFESIEPTEEVDEIDGTRLKIRVWGRVDYLDSLTEVPNKIVKIINYLQKYFNCSIGLPKLDIMAVPMYNAAKASDSWGLMFFKESELSSSLIWNTAYELIYQWIGQYITPYNWYDAPVSKALNSFLASMTTVDLNPDEMEGKWPMTMLYSLYYEFAQATPFSRVAGIMHEATSAKTELVFRMLNYTLGKDAFRNSVRNFIKQQSEVTLRTFYANDIYTHLGKEVPENANLPKGVTIRNIASRWINRNRLPLVTVIRDYKLGTITFTQKLYLRDTRVTVNEHYSHWDIPIVLLTEKNLNFSQTYPSFWLTQVDGFQNRTIEDTAGEDFFVIVNPEEIGMFPVNYDSCNWKMLAQFLQGPKRERIPVLTRAKLLHDSWNLAYAGELCFGIALNMTLFLKNEKSHVVWEPIFPMIDHFGKRIESLNTTKTTVYTKFETYVRLLLEPLYMELGDTPQPGEPSWKVHLRGLTKNFLCRAGYEPCVKEARDQYSKWLMDQEPDKGNPVANEYICPVFKWGTYEEWEFGLQRVINFPRNSMERKQNERTYLLKTLAGCPKDPEKIERLLNVTILEQNGNFSDADIQLILSMLNSGVASYTTLFNFLNEHWSTVMEKFENKKYLWRNIINYTTSSLNTSAIFNNRSSEFEAGSFITDKAVQNIDRDTIWNEENLAIIEAWLDKNLPEEVLQKIEKEAANTMGTMVTPSAW